MGWSQRKSSGRPEERKQLIRGSWSFPWGQSGEEGHPQEAAAGSSGQPCHYLRILHPASCSVQWAQFLLPCLLERAPPDCAQGTGVGEGGQQRPPRMTQHWTPCRGEPGNAFLFSARKTKTWRRQVLARPTGWTRGDHSRRQLALPRGCPKPLLLSPHLLPLISSECAHRGLPVAASPGIRSPASTANTPTVTARSSWRLPLRLCVCACVCLCVLTKRG